MKDVKYISTVKYIFHSDVNLKTSDLLLSEEWLCDNHYFSLCTKLFSVLLKTCPLSFQSICWASKGDGGRLINL